MEILFYVALALFPESRASIQCGLKPLKPLGCDNLICICDSETGMRCSWVCVND